MKRLVALAAVAVLGVVGCSPSSAGNPSGSPTSSSVASGAGTVSVVASTSVYGDIVKTIGGPAVAVTSIIDRPDKDPHEHEADAQTQLALSKAQLVIENGGGYDDFVDTMLKSVRTKPTVINVADVSGLNQHPAEEGSTNTSGMTSPPWRSWRRSWSPTFPRRSRPSRHLREQRQGVHRQARPVAARRGCHQGEACRRGCGDHRAGAAVPARGGRAGQQDPGGLQRGHRGEHRHAPRC